MLAAVFVYRLEGFSRAVFIFDAVLLLVSLAAIRVSFHAASGAAVRRLHVEIR